MSRFTYPVSQLPSAVDFLFYCNGTFTLTLRGKRHWTEYADSDIHRALEKEVFAQYLRAAINLNVSRYGHKEEDIRIVVHEPSIDELLEDF